MIAAAMESQRAALERVADPLAGRVLLIARPGPRRTGRTIQLESDGYDVSVVETLAAALERHREPAVDIVFLDAIDMPPAEVAEAVQAIRNHYATTGMPIVLSSNHDVRVLVESGLRLSAYDHILNPPAHGIAIPCSAEPAALDID